MTPNPSYTVPTRRDFLRTSGAAAAASTLAAGGVFAAGGDTLKVGLIGCGGRGTGAAAQALNADANVKLTAMADAFEDRLQQSLKKLQADPKITAKIDVKPDHCFVGFDAYKQVIDSGVDVVLLCTPPGFRPLHLKAAVDAGKHVFAEKPVAVDAPGVRSVLATCELARKKNLSVVSGLCLRYDNSFREAVKRLHAGQAGEVVTLQANDYRGPIWVKPRQPDWSDMVWHMRNWYYFTWLSGDFNVEQHVHFLDVCGWVLKNSYPVKAVGMGGRAARTGDDYGHIYDHFSVVYEYAGGVKLFANCRQQANCHGDMSAHVLGTKGHAVLSDGRQGVSITGEQSWAYDGAKNEMYQAEHDELFAAIRKGEPINNGEYMAKSTLVAIMGRMAAYTGQAITWDMALHSKEDLTPPKYDWNVPLPMPPIAVPGKTKFV
jgi:predicted dehydrogenase